MKVHPYGIVGHSRAIADVIRRIELVSATRSTVLITGETGTGKELVARAVHDRSAQRDMPFIKVNLCGHSRDPAGIRALRPCQRSIHRRHRHEERQVLPGQSRLHLPRRDRNDEHRPRRPSCCVLQEREIEPLGAERTEHVDVSRDRGDQSQPPSARRRGRCSRTICFIACTWSQSSCRRFANASRIFQCWWSTSPANMRRGAASRSTRSRTA